MAKIAFIGLGMMGSPMTANLIAAGNQLWVKDANEAVEKDFAATHKCERLTVGSVDVDVVITMLPNSKIVEAVLGELVPRLVKPTTIIDMSSSDPLRTRDFAATVKDKGHRLLDAPVSGGQKRAVTGTLAIMVGGELGDFSTAEAVLNAMGKSVHVGPVGAGHALKALNNYVSAAALIATVEVIHVGQAFGLDPEVMVDVLNTSTGRNNTTENKVKQFMLNGAYNSAFSLGLLAKDVGIAVDLGERLGEAMPLGAITKQVWQDANAKAPDADHTELYRLI